jgi:hypothetical protein
MEKCQCKTQKGTQCKNNKLAGSNFCKTHQKCVSKETQKVSKTKAKKSKLSKTKTLDPIASKQAMIFGFADTSSVIEANMKVTYGFALYNASRESWYYTIGSFPYIYGILQTFQMISEDECSENFPAFAMFVLDKNRVPSKIIPNLSVSEKLKKSISLDSPAIIRDLIYIDDEFILPPMHFEY